MYSFDAIFFTSFCRTELRPVKRARSSEDPSLSATVATAEGHTEWAVELIGSLLPATRQLPSLGKASLGVAPGHPCRQPPRLTKRYLCRRC